MKKINILSRKSDYREKRIIVTDNYIEFIGFPLSKWKSEISIYKSEGANKIILYLEKKEKRRHIYNFILKNKRLNKKDNVLQYYNLVSLLYSVKKKDEFYFINLDDAYYLINN